jgi:hypothetical protein
METFLLRVWMPGDAAGEAGADPRLRGHVGHVGSGRERPFGGLEELLAFLHQCLDALAASSETEQPRERREQV